VADTDVADAMARSFLGKLPPDVVAALTADGDRTDYPAGSTVYRGGSAPRAALVAHGLIRVYMTSPEGRQVTVRYARDSDVLGIALIVGGPLNERASRLLLSRVCSASTPEPSWRRHDARVAWAVAEELNRRLDETLQQTAINAFGSVKQRVAAHLLDIASAQQRPQARLVARVSQQELADAVGSVREVVARVLRDLRLAGLVATSPDSVLILDAARLNGECWGRTGA